MRKIATGLAVAGLVLAGGIGAATNASAAQPGMNCSNYSTWEPLLRGGENNDAVKALQCELNLSVYGANLTIDGKFGPATLAQVNKLQSCTGLTVDGQVGPLTWSKLDYYSNAPVWAC